MDRSYKIYKSYHTSHHNTTKTHLQISTPPSSVQQRTDIHNLPPNHKESQASKLQASSNAPTLTTSRQTHRISSFQTTGVQQRADAHNLPNKHIESQASKLQASSNAPTLTTSPANHKETQPFLPAIQRSADGSSNSRQTTLSLPP